MSSNAGNFTANLLGARSLAGGIFAASRARVGPTANATGPTGPTPAGSIPSGKCESAGCQRIKNTNIANNGGLYCCITCKANSGQHGRSCSNALYAAPLTSESTTE
jgi:hypothetical protein